MKPKKQINHMLANLDTDAGRFANQQSLFVIYQRLRVPLVQDLFHGGINKLWDELEERPL